MIESVCVCVWKSEQGRTLHTSDFAIEKPGTENVVQTTVLKEAQRLACKLSLQLKN